MSIDVTLEIDTSTTPDQVLDMVQAVVTLRRSGGQATTDAMSVVVTVQDGPSRQDSFEAFGVDGRVSITFRPLMSRYSEADRQIRSAVDAILVGTKGDAVLIAWDDRVLARRSADRVEWPEGRGILAA